MVPSVQYSIEHNLTTYFQVEFVVLKSNALSYTFKVFTQISATRSVKNVQKALDS